MKLFVAVCALISVSACSRSSARPNAQAVVRSSVPVAANSPSDHEAEEQREVMEALREVSAFPDTAEGLRGFITELSRVTATHDHAQEQRIEREFLCDNTRFELAFTFEGSRLLRDRVVSGIEPRAEALRTHLAALPGPVTINLASALGSELADGLPHGMSAGITTVKQYLRPAVRFYRAEVVATNGQRVVLEPMAWLAGRWTWLGEPWAVAAPGVPTTTAATAGSAAR
jgi:hypothetical protein